MRFVTFLILSLIQTAPAFAACDVYGNCEDAEDFAVFPKSKAESPEIPKTETPDIKPAESGRDYTGTAIDFKTDGQGNVRGRIGGDNVNLSPDRLGGLSGTIGGDSASLYKDRLGGVKGNIGQDSVDLYESRTGSVSGTIGGQHVTCYENRIGQTTCH